MNAENNISITYNRFKAVAMIVGLGLIVYGGDAIELLRDGVNSNNRAGFSDSLDATINANEGNEREPDAYYVPTQSLIYENSHSGATPIADAGVIYGPPVPSER